ncbi:hypothetical protein DCC85_20630 [Paenibacillus sp. CAA11]|uniref:DUF1700 domain-containing protein n=1 Tax=Paenibacillus sp. CAA11 TaxID=1532905 RepID=UPI000D3ABC56|nr:DUF1700 domain-containing protein [Paenibacillus sp. CAA11]AWB46333.1 hypothetical protein DCC85_20630 [Paenibacillus sp. CAA11]
MTKNEFLAILESHLAVLPPEELAELMEDYEAHFAFALASGKSEEEVVTELGNPAELAKEALGDRYVAPNPVYWYYNGEPEQAPGSAETAGAPRKRGVWASTGIYISLFFIHIISVPLLFAFWTLGASIVIGGAAGIMSPVLVGLDYVLSDSFTMAKLYASVSMIGIGILLIIASKHLLRAMTVTTINYWRWTFRLAKGNQAK